MNMDRDYETLNRRQRTLLRTQAERLHTADDAYRRAERSSLVRFTLIALVVVFVVKLFLFEPTPVSGASMLPTLHDAERMYVDKTAYWFEEPARGDIITCYYPNQELSRVKRVIGLPGETVSIWRGRVYIDGAALDESAYWRDEILRDMDGVRVPAGHVFVMGDNRNNSGDSRSADVGPIPYWRIVGRARCVIWPLDALRSLELRIG